MRVTWPKRSLKSPMGHSRIRVMAMSGAVPMLWTLKAVLWALYNTDDFEEGVLRVVNLGDDADTTGAIYGQIAGAYYGVEAIPPNWRRRIAMSSEITQMADGLFEGSGLT